MTLQVDKITSVYIVKLNAKFQLVMHSDSVYKCTL